MHTRRIMKFGGSSLSDADCFKRVKEIIMDRIALNPVVVVSALGVDKEGLKITDALKNIALAALEGSEHDNCLQILLQRHYRLIRELKLPDEIIASPVEQLQQTLSAVSQRVYSSKEEALDAVMGFGEILSSVIMAAYLSSEGVPFAAADPAEFSFISDENFQDADILEETLPAIAAKVISCKELQVFPGYIAVTRDGRRTTLGRGGSDYTGAVLGAALKRDVEIWTDVDGIYSINPGYLPPQFREVGHPATIPELSYEEAFQMASFGSKVLHKKTLLAVQQAVKKGKHIHIFIKNTFNPQHPGTDISSRRKQTGLPVGITCLEGTHLLNMYPRSYEESAAITGKLDEVEGLHRVLSSNTWGRASFVFDTYNPVLSQLEAEYTGHLSRDQVLVKIVGDGLGENPGILARIQNAINSAENPEKYGMTLVHKSPQLLTDNTFEFLVKKRGLNDILMSLYKALFMQDIVTVGLLGMGTVGGGVISYAKESYSSEKSGFRLNFPLSLVRNPEKQRDVPFEGKFTKNVEDILDNPLVDIVVELIGGIEPARAYIINALKKGKHVVTANKALLALHGTEIFQAADKYQKNVGFEASVCAEIPIIDDFLNFPGLADIEGIQGIVNGTSNYVLTRFMEGMSFDEAVKLAQEKGFAEADPAMDISGADAAQKLSILASILFNQTIDFNRIPCQGIDGLLPIDCKAFKGWGVTVKPLIMAGAADNKLQLNVAPALVSENHPLASVREENNALSLYLKGRREPITKIGKGAGAIPTARSVVRDILDVSGKSRAYMTDVPGFYKTGEVRELSPASGFEAPWYVRYTVKDTPGVMGKIATILGDFELSILKVLQEKDPVTEEAHILFELKTSPREKLDRANDIITRFPFVEKCFYCMMV